MKKLFIAAMMILVSAYGYADEIHLKDGSIVKGKIITVTDLVVAYDPEGDNSYEVIKRAKIVKIVYDNGKALVFDWIALKKMNDPKYSIYKYGVILAETNEEGTKSEKISNDSFFSTVNFNIACGFNPFPGVWGDVIDAEDKSVTVTFSNGTTKTDRPADYIRYHIGIWCDITPFDPIMNKAQDAGVKYGVRGRVGYYYIEQHFIFSDEMIKDYKYMSFKSALIGPVIRWAPFISQKENGLSSWFVLTIFAQIGPIFDGVLHPRPALQNEGQIPKMESEFAGIRMEFGTGFEFSGGTKVHFGTNFYYARNMIKMSPNYYTDVSSKTVIHEFDFELYVGFSF